MRFFSVFLLLIGAKAVGYAQIATENDCANAIVMGVTSNSCIGQEFNVNNASLSGSDPNPSCWSNPPSNTVWFKFTPDSSSVSITTNFSGNTVNETQLAVYDGTCGAFNEIGCSDDITATNPFSRTQVDNLTPGTTYYIMIDTEGENGNFFLCIENVLSPGSPDPIQDCPTARFICSKATIYVPNGTGSSGIIEESPTCFSSGGERSSHWYRFFVKTSGTLGFSIKPNPDADYDFALYDITNTPEGSSFCDLENEIACNWSNWSGGDGTTGLGCTNFVPAAGPPCDGMVNVTAGRTYALMVSRFTENSTSGYDLEWAGSSEFGVPDIDFFNSTSCVNTPTQFSFLNQGSYSYTWDFGDGSSSNLQNPSHVFPNSGNFLVKLYTSSIPGNCSSYKEKLITVVEPSVSISPTDPDICEGDDVNFTTVVNLNPPGPYTTFHQNKTGGNIPDNGIPSVWNGNQAGFLESSIPVNDLNPGSWDVDKICFSAAHPNVGDIQIVIVTPCGDVTRMVRNSGGSGNNFFNTCFSKTASAGTTIDSDTPPFSGTYVPEDNSLFWSILTSCSNPNGVWKMRIGDDKTNDLGVLLNWSIEFSSQNGIKSFSWSPTTELANSGSLSPTASPTVNRTYQLLVNDYLNCSSVDASSITVNPKPDAGAANAVYFCSRDENISLFPLLQGTPDNFGSWTDLDGSGALTGASVNINNLDGTYRYRYTVTGTNGCANAEAVVTLIVEKNKSPGTDSAIQICPEAQTIPLFNNLGGSPDNGGTWTSIAPGTLSSTSGLWQVPNAISTGAYSFTYTIAAGQICPERTAEVVVNVQTKPSPREALICRNSTSYNLNAALDNPHFVMGSWQEQSTSGALSNGSYFDPSGYTGTQEFVFQITGFDYCPNLSSLNVPVQILDTLKAGIPFYTCSDDDSEFVANIPLSGGAPPYSTSSGSINNAAPFIAATTPYPSLSTQTIILNDSLGCGPISVNVSADCNCTTNAGTMENVMDTLRNCGDGAHTAVHNGDFINDGDDNLVFVLHESPFPYISNLKATSNNPTFSHQPGIEYNKIYYISAVAGNRNGPSAVDYLDPCLSVSPGKPVEWRLDPELVFSLDPEICEGQTGTLVYELTQGAGPATITVNINGTPTQIYLSEDSGSVVLSPNITSTYNITYIEDIAGCASNLNLGSKTMVVTPSPNGSISLEGSACSDDNPHQIKVHLSGKGTFFDVFVSSEGGSESFSNIDSGSVITVNPTQFPSTYTLDSISDLAGNKCPSILSGTVDFFPSPRSSFSMDPIHCEGDLIPIQFSSTSFGAYILKINVPGTGDSLLLGNTPELTLNVPAMPAGNYSVYLQTIKDTISGCEYLVDQIFNFTVNPSPRSDLSGDIILCQEAGLKSELNLSGTIGVPPFVAYFSSNYQGAFNLNFTQDTTFLVLAEAEPGQTITNNYFVLDSIKDGSNGCVGKWNDTVNVQVKATPSYTHSSDSYEICSGETAIITLDGFGYQSMRGLLAGTNNNGDTLFKDIYFINEGAPIQIPYTLTDTTHFSIIEFEDRTNPICTGNLIPGFTVNVNPLPQIQFTSQNGKTEFCSTDTLYLQVTNGTFNAFSLDIEYDLGIISSNETINGSSAVFPIPLDNFNPGTRQFFATNITDITPAGCTANFTDTLSINIYDNPSVKLERISNLDVACEGDLIDFLITREKGFGNLNIIGELDGLPENWTLVGDSLFVSYPVSQSHLLELIVTQDNSPAGCSSLEADMERFRAKALPDFSLDGVVPVCEEGLVEIPYEAFGEGSILVYFSTSTDSTFVVQTTAGESSFPFFPNTNGNIVLSVDSIWDSGVPSCLFENTGITTQVQVFPTPEVRFSGLNLSGCPPLELVLINETPEVYRTNGVSTWTVGNNTFVDNSDSLKLTFKNSGLIDVRLHQVSEQGCEGSNSELSYIDVYPVPEPDFRFSPESPDLQNSIVDFENLSFGADFYQWTFDTLGGSTKEEPQFNFPNLEEGSYTVCLLTSNQEGCTEQMCTRITIEGRVFVFIPNAFTPDNNGKNDIFLPVVSGIRDDIKGYTFLIFDRWGRQIFASNDPDQGWDGTMPNGKMAIPGVYTYSLKLFSKYRGQIFQYNGPIQLIR